MITLYTAFAGYRRLCHGPLATVTRTVLAMQASGSPDTILIFDDATGRQTDPDGRTNLPPISEAVGAEASPDDGGDLPAAKGRGRPKLGVIGREVTLLPRHWDWLAAQPGGASVVLRRLIDDARRAEAAAPSPRQRQEAAYRFLQAIAGDLPGYEEVLRALFAGDPAAFAARMADWPHDLRTYAVQLATR